MNHPPLPPNCDCLRSVDGKLQSNISGDWLDWGDLGSREQHGAICVARCAWLDEQRRLLILIPEADGYGFRWNKKENRDNYAASEEAESNAWKWCGFQ